MAQWVKAHEAKPVDLSLISKAHGRKTELTREVKYQKI